MATNGLSQDIFNNLSFGEMDTRASRIEEKEQRNRRAKSARGWEWLWQGVNCFFTHVEDVME